MRRYMRYSGFFLLATMLFLSGCALFGINTAQKLAKALKDKGIAYQSVVNLPTKSSRSPRTGEELKLNEAVDLKGNDIYIEIMRINNKQTFQKFAPALQISLAMIETLYKMPQGSIPAYLKYPFAVVVIAEPSPGQVREALKQIFPREPIQEVVATEESYKVIEQLKSQIQAIFK